MARSPPIRQTLTKAVDAVATGMDALLGRGCPNHVCVAE